MLEILSKLGIQLEIEKKNAYPWNMLCFQRRPLLLFYTLFHLNLFFLYFNWKLFRNFILSSAKCLFRIQIFVFFCLTNSLVSIHCYQSISTLPSSNCFKIHPGYVDLLTFPDTCFYLHAFIVGLRTCMWNICIKNKFLIVSTYFSKDIVQYVFVYVVVLIKLNSKLNTAGWSMGPMVQTLDYSPGSAFPLWF